MAKEEVIIPKAWNSWRLIKKSDPKRLTKLIEVGIKLRGLRKSLEAHAALVKKEQDEVEKFLINNFGASELKQVKTRAGTAYLAEKDVPKAKNWGQIEKYIYENKALDILQRRLGEKACQERWEHGEAIPGVEKYHDKRIKFGED